MYFCVNRSHNPERWCCVICKSVALDVWFEINGWNLCYATDGFRIELFQSFDRDINIVYVPVQVLNVHMSESGDDHLCGCASAVRWLPNGRNVILCT